MSILQSIQINPTDCKLVLAEIQMDPTAFHTEPGPNRPGAVSTFKFRVIGFVKREIVQISSARFPSHPNSNEPDIERGPGRRGIMKIRPIRPTF